MYLSSTPLLRNRSTYVCFLQDRVTSPVLNTILEGPIFLYQSCPLLNDAFQDLTRLLVVGDSSFPLFYGQSAASTRQQIRLSLGTGPHLHDVAIIPGGLFFAVIYYP
jgi:hypothetical protein